jgi:hypothetical protein
MRVWGILPTAAVEGVAERAGGVDDERSVDQPTSATVAASARQLPRTTTRRRTGCSPWN